MRLDVNAQAKAVLGYSQANRSTRTPRAMECELIAQISQRIKQAALSRGPDAFPKLVEALSANRELWTVFAANVADPSNAMPEELRAQIFYLAEFVEQHTAKVLKKQARIAPLLEINAAILKGLRQTGIEK